MAGLAVGIYAIAAVVVGLYGLAQAHLLWIAWSRRAAPVVPRDHRPAVTVQLPLYNEAAVVEDLVASVGRLDWPADKLQIQVLDDSTDGTVPLAAAAVARLADRLDIQHVRRPDRSGFKAGALVAGLESATGEFVAILDADFRPHPDFLVRCVDAFTPEVGLVQARAGGGSTATPTCSPGCCRCIWTRTSPSSSPRGIGGGCCSASTAPPGCGGGPASTPPAVGPPTR